MTQFINRSIDRLFLMNLLIGVALILKLPKLHSTSLETIYGLFLLYSSINSILIRAFFLHKQIISFILSFYCLELCVLNVSDNFEIICVGLYCGEPPKYQYSVLKKSHCS